MRGEGEEEGAENDSDDPRSLASKGPWQLLFVFVAGVVMNVILAFTLLYMCFLIGFQPIYTGMWNHPGIKNDLRVEITDVEKNTPAETEGIKAGDIIKQVDSNSVYLSSEVLSIIRSKNGADGASVNLVILRDGTEMQKTLITYKAKVAGSGGKEVEVSRVGVVLATNGKISGNIISSIGASLGETWHVVQLTFMGIIDLFEQLITKFTVSDNVSGPVGIYVATNYFAALGIMYLIQFAALLSISLAVFNVLPIPGLDGGHIATVALEAIFRRKFSTKTKNIIQLVGFGLLILLMITVTVKDFANFDIIGYVKGVFK
jgi:regulator of sigma E protease